MLNNITEMRDQTAQPETLKIKKVIKTITS